MVAALHRAGLEVVFDVVYNHTAEGGDGRPGALPPGPRRRRLLPTRARTVSCSTRRAAATRSTRRIPPRSRSSSTRCATGCRSATSTAFGSISRRPSRGRRGRFDPAAPFLAVHRAGPDAARREADCEPWDVGCEDSYALGRFRCTVPRVEREVPRHGARLLAWRGRGARFERCSWPSAGRPTSSGSPRDGTRPVLDQLVTSHDGFTLHRPRQLQREAQRGERRGRVPTGRTTTAPGTAASRGRPTTRRSSSRAPGAPARCCDAPAQPGGPDAARR